MKKFFLIMLIAFAANTVIAGNTDPEATQTVKGQVLDEQGAPLAGVEVIVEGVNKKVYTDFDGNFEVSQLKNGVYTLVFNFVSFKETKSVVNTIQKGDNGTVITLHHKKMKLQ